MAIRQSTNNLISLSMMPMRQSLAFMANTLDVFSRFTPWGTLRSVSALNGSSEGVQTVSRGGSNGHAESEPLRVAAAGSAKPVAKPAAAKRPTAKPAAAKRAATKPAAAKRPASAKPVAKRAATKPAAAKRPATAKLAATKRPAAAKPATKRPGATKPAAAKNA